MREAASIGITVCSLHRDTTPHAAKPQASPMIRERCEDLAEPETAAALFAQSGSGPILEGSTNRFVVQLQEGKGWILAETIKDTDAHICDAEEGDPRQCMVADQDGRGRGVDDRV